MSAILCFKAWNAPICFPKANRSSEYFFASSSETCAPPTCSKENKTAALLKILSIISQPLPSSPSLSHATFSKSTVQAGLVGSMVSKFEIFTPGSFLSIIKREREL